MRSWLLLIAVGCGDVQLDETPSYDADIAGILEVHCVRCHATPTEYNGGLAVGTYTEASAAAQRITCTSITQGLVDDNDDILVPFYEPGVPCSPWDTYSMPPGATTKLSSLEQLMLVDWYRAGTPR